MTDLSSIIEHIVAGFYETFSWVQWKLNVTYFSGKNDININSFQPIQVHEIRPCQIDIQKLLMHFSPNTKQRIEQRNRINGMPCCNKTEFVKIEIVNADTTRITIPGGIFRPIPTRSQRSIIHLGTGKTNVFQWENWQLHGSIRIPTWYIITIKNGPVRNNITEIHFVLEQQTSYLTAIPDLMLSNTLLPSETFMAYHKGYRYCERTNAAKVDMYNSRHIKQQEYKQCYHYHNNTNICKKTQDPQCKFVVGSLKLAMENLEFFQT